MATLDRPVLIATVDVHGDSLVVQTTWRSSVEEDNGSGLTGETKTDGRLRREALRRAGSAGTGTSPAALETTLASISAEVTTEAIERLRHNKKPR
jgi:hypothetical protein